ncbi:MAG: hypothetical protein K2K53_05825, partial [Oscillospiraceae bacterium]|nr:hypothetical protein [Oscillospiraceae bacterium]
MRNDLPKTCYATMPGTGELIVLKRGERGYSRSELGTPDKWESQKIADRENQRLGVNPVQATAMLAGAMYGFDKPEANPQHYFDEARHVSTHQLDPGNVLYIGGTPHEIGGAVHQYQVAGETRFYLDPASMPETVMGMRSDSTILPDVIHGKPLIPITLKWMERGGFEMAVDHGAFSRSRERNENYQITAKVHVGPVEYVLAERGGKVPSFVTWEHTPAKDRDG